MPQCSTAKNPKGIEILFTEETHQYTSVIKGKTIEYTSGTKFIEQFFEPFDPTGEITRRCAKKEGITVEELKRRWRAKADNSCLFGTKIHESAEDVLKGDPIRNKITDLIWKHKQSEAMKIAAKIKDRSDILGIEKIVFSPDLKIAGTIDLLVRDKKDGQVWIMDWKTNEKIEEFNKYNKFALKPITNVPDTNYGHYNLQLSLYEYLLKREGYIEEDEVVNRCLIHLTETGHKFYKLQDRHDDIEKMIKYWKKNGCVIKKV